MSQEKTQEALMKAVDKEILWQVLQEAFTVHQLVRERNNKASL